MNEDEHAEGTQTESSGGAGDHPHRPREERPDGDDAVGERHDAAAAELREARDVPDTMGNE